MSSITIISRLLWSILVIAVELYSFVRSCIDLGDVFGIFGAFPQVSECACILA